MKSSARKRSFLLALCIVGTVLFTSLGIWQIERRSWKLNLIAQVDSRIHAQPVGAPPPKAWPALRPDDYAYRNVRIVGTFQHDHETLVDALTERGAGFWVLTPLRTDSGTILINRGFVPPELRMPSARQDAQVTGLVTITGLMRPSEPEGRFLRPNKPKQNLWYSRDISAIAAARSLSNVAPFFVDANAATSAGGFPVGGLTIVQFRNTHLIYALTWFGLALLSLAGLVLLRVPAHKRP